MQKGNFSLNLDQIYGEAKMAGRDAQLEDEFFSFYKLLRDNHEFKLFLEDPRIAAEYKKTCVKKMCPENISQEFLSTVFTLIENGREELVEEISKDFTKRLSKDKHVVPGEVMSVVEIPQNMRSSLERAMRKTVKEDVLLRYSTEPDMLGGISVRLLTGEVWDLSIKHLFDGLRSAITES